MLTHPPTDADQARYQQIARSLRGEIASGYRSGEFLPSEQVLANRFEVNRHTLRRAVEELIDAGVVERRRGRGTMVLDPAIIFPIRSRTRFSETLAALGRDADNRLLGNRVSPATSEVAEVLGLREGAAVVWLEMQRMVDGSPVSVASAFFDAGRFPGLPEEYFGGSLHCCLEKYYGVSPRRLRSTITAVMPATDDAHNLRIPRNRPLLRIKSINVDEDDRPVEYCITRMRSDRCQLEVEP